MECSKDILYGLQHLQKTMRFSDFEIINNNESYLAHRNILASNSGYFSALLSHDVCETKEKRVQFYFDKLCFDVVFEFCYTGQIDIDSDNFEGIFEISQYLQMNSLMKLCDRFLSVHLITNPSSELIKYLFSHDMQISPDQIKNNFKKKLMLIFSESIEKYIFLRTDYEELRIFIINKEVTVTDEYYIVKAVVMWVQYDIESRIQFAESLLSLVNCSLCSKSLMMRHRKINTTSSLLKYLIQNIHLKISILHDNSTSKLINLYNLDNISGIDVPLNVSDIQTLISKSLYGIALKYNLDREHLNELLRHAPYSEYTLHTKNHDIFLISFSNCKMMKYNLRDKLVKRCGYPTYMTHSVIFNYPPTINEISGNRLVAIGGIINDISDKVWYYDIETDFWSEQTSLPHCLWMHSTVVMGDEIYVTGGVDNRNIVNDVLKFSDGVWSQISSLVSNRRCHVSWAHGNRVYVYGGHNKSDCECLDTLTGTWTKIDTELYRGVHSDASVVNDNFIFTNDIEGRLFSINLYTKEKILVFRNSSYDDCSSVVSVSSSNGYDDSDID